MRSYSQQSDQLNKLSELFGPVERSIRLPVTDLCSRAEFYDESPELLTSVCSMYYISRLLLYASMVPIFSACSSESPIPRDAVRKNAEIVLQQATEFVKLLQQFVAKDLDMTRLWPFSGYGAFVAGSVFMVRSSQYKCHARLCRMTTVSMLFEWCFGIETPHAKVLSIP